MNLSTIGTHIREYRLKRKMRQVDLAEQSGLTDNYIGMIERGEKIPSLESFINIANCLEVSPDLLLIDVINTGYELKDSLLSEKMDKLTPADRDKIYDVIETLLKHSQKIKP